MTTIPGLPADPSGLFRRSAMIADGFAPGEIDRLLRSGVVRPVRRGTYRATDTAPASSEQDHALRCRALYPELTAGAFGYVSAAVLLGLPVWGVPLGKVHVVRDRSGSGQIRSGVHLRGSPLAAHDVVEIDGLRVTSAARTAADMARTFLPEAALVTVDGALYRAWRATHHGEFHPGAATAAEIDEVLRQLARRRGVPGARRLLALADERSESPGESRSRLGMHLAGLPPPRTQWEVPGLNFRTDFAWPERGVVGEFDGREKYGRSTRPGEDLRETLWREKRREDRIRATGLIVVRWTWRGITSAASDGMLPQLTALLRR